MHVITSIKNSKILYVSEMIILFLKVRNEIHGIEIQLCFISSGKAAVSYLVPRLMVYQPIQCGAVITWSIFSKILTKYIP